jgi:hypothetical protein
MRFVLNFDGAMGHLSTIERAIESLAQLPHFDGALQFLDKMSNAVKEVVEQRTSRRRGTTEVGCINYLHAALLDDRISTARYYFFRLYQLLQNRFTR